VGFLTSVLRRTLVNSHLSAGALAEKESMNRKKDSPGLKLYYETQAEIFRLQSRILTGVLTHSGERGRNDEQNLREFLSRILPKRFSIGTGFIVSADLATPPSRQTDIVISDQFWNPALYRELVAGVYPVETVYATIEVKGVLQKAPKGNRRTTDLDEALINIARIRTLAKHKKYVEYIAVDKSADEPGNKVVGQQVYTMKTSPRAYIFAYSKKGWRSRDAFRESLENHLRRHPGAHLHGILVLENEWFAFQEPYNPQIAVHVFEGNALIRFVNAMLRGIQSIPMGIASIDDYHRTGLFESVKAGDPQESAFEGDPEPQDAARDDD
jgi:hypothetical protein